MTNFTGQKGTGTVINFDTRLGDVPFWDKARQEALFAEVNNRQDNVYNNLTQGTNDPGVIPNK